MPNTVQNKITMKLIMCARLDEWLEGNEKKKKIFAADKTAKK